MKKCKKDVFFVLVYRGYPGHYYMDSYCSNVLHKNRLCLSTTDILKARRFNSKKEALKDKPKNRFNVCKVTIDVTSV